jgi:hypothetical protein
MEILIDISISSPKTELHFNSDYENYITHIYKMKILLLILLQVLFQAYLSDSISQVNKEWVNRYNGSANSFDIVNTMFLDDNSNVYVTGNSYNLNTQQDITVIKYNTKGEQIWVKNFDSGLNSIDLVNAASLLDNRFIFLAGTFVNAVSISKALIIKMDSSGNIEWINFFEDSLYISSSGIDIKNDIHGNSFALISARNPAGKYNIILLKMDPFGNIVWKRQFDENELNYTPSGIVLDGKGDCYISSSVQNINGYTDIITLKYSSGGNFIYKRVYPGISNTDSRPVSIISTLNNEIVVTGVTYSLQSHFDIVTLKYNPAGDLLWNRIFNGSGNNLDYPYDLTSDATGNIYITGSSRSDSSLGSEDIVILKYDADGNPVVSSTYNGKAGGSDIGFSIALDDDNNIYIGGSTDRGNFQMIFATLKFDPAGNFNWIQTYYDSNTPEDFIYKIALNKEREIFVTGISFNSETDYDFTTIKYSQSVGIQSNNEFIPEKYELFQNYPNPFNPTTNIGFQIPVFGFVTLKVFDIAGKEIATLVNQNLEAGEYSYKFSIYNPLALAGYHLGSGVYFYQLSAGNFIDTKKFILLK